VRPMARESRSGWRGHRREHMLAAYGIPTRNKQRKRMKASAIGDRTTVTGEAAYYEQFLALKLDSDGNKYWDLEDTGNRLVPAELRQLVKEIHDSPVLGEIEPDDYRYRFMAEAIQDFVDTPDSSPESDENVFTLTGWLSSDENRALYLEEAIDRWGDQMTGYNMLRNAQYIEKLEIYEQVLSFLQQEAREERTLERVPA